MNAPSRFISSLARTGLRVMGLIALALCARADLSTPTFTNVTVHDPSVVRDGWTYYIFGSHMASASSSDLMNWSQITTSAAFPNSLIRNQNPQAEFAATLTYAGGVNTFWAPDVIKLGDGKYYYYYCACQGSSPLSALGLARADAITGPYADVGILLKSAGATPTVSPYDVNTMPNVVDPSVFYDNTGKLWMVYGSFSGGIFILQLDSTIGSPTIGQPLAGQAYGKKLVGGNSSRIEGAYIIYSPETSYYYLFCTFGGLDAAGGYNIRVGRSLNPDGPFLDAAGNDLTNVKGSITDDSLIAPYGVKLMGNWQFSHVANDLRSTSRGYVSPGGVSVNRDPGTGKYLLVFHTRFVGSGEVHEVRAHQMYLNADGWFVAAPHRYAQETITTTPVSQIPGDYKLINHGKDVTATVKTSSLIALNADGSITGTATGTWSLSGDHNASVRLDGTSYHGVFSRQWDDDNQAWTLTFSALSGNGVAVWGSKVAALSTDVPPVITTQPVSQTIALGAAVTFTAGASGTPSPTFQWQKSGVTIAGATNPAYSIASVSAGAAGSYTVVATNTAGAVTSNAATLTVSIATSVPVITTQPANQTVTTGSAVTLTVTTTGNPAPTYQWYKNGTSVAGATSASFTIAVVQLSDAAIYQVVASNSSGTVTSAGATLTVYTLPVFTTQPLSHAAFVGGTVSMICVVTGTPLPTYQWQKGGIDLPGATSSTLTINNVQLSDAGSYGLVATSAEGGSVTSRFARLVVLVSQQNAITYATTRSSTGVTAGGMVNFDYFVTNVGTKAWGAHHYLSIRDINNTFVAFSSLIGILPGETTTANLNFPAPATPGTYTYYVQGLEDGVEFFSTQTTVTLTVLAPLANAITYNTTSFPVSAAPGSNVIFTYNVTNTGTATWGANHILSLKNGSGTTLATTPLTVLAPGASKTVNLNFTVPSTPSSYNYTVQASQTGVGNFGTQANLTLVALAPQPNAIVYNRVRYPDEVVPGAGLNLKYTLSNAGTQAWGAGHYVSLRDSAANYLAFIPLAGTAAGGTKTVEFTLTAPTTPGTYTYYVQALEDGIEFFSTQDIVIITVAALPLGNAISYNTSTIPVTATPGATVNFTANVTNRGTRTWGATHYLSFRDVDNTFLAFPTLNGVAPGASRTSSLGFTAPTTPGIYTYTLQAFEDGVAFFEMADTVVLLVQ